MSVIYQIKSSGLEFGNRIDAELYNPRLRVSFQKLLDSAYNSKPLRSLCQIRSGTTPPDRAEGLTIGPVLFKTTDIRNDILPPSDKYFHISPAIHKRMVRTQLISQDVLLNIVGATLDVIGRSGFINKLPTDGANITQAMVLIRPWSNEVRAGFLFAFLNTVFAQDQIKRYARPTGQYNLNLTEVGHLRIPILTEQDQLNIHSLVVSASDSIEKAGALFLQATSLLETELGLGKFRFRKPVGFTAQFSEVETSRRLDSEHFFPEFKSFIQSLPTKITLAPLSQHLTFCQRGKQPRYVESGFPVINSRHVYPNRVILEDNRQAVPGLLSELQIRTGDILMNGTGRGTLGRVAPYLAAENALPDNHVTILRSSTLDPVFASFYLNSRAGQMQVEMRQRGSSGQLELYPFDIRKFQIWEAPESVQKEIRKLYDRGAAAEAKSKHLLAEAKARVEQLIEEAVAK
jgi:type I restriction enzyme M protein